MSFLHTRRLNVDAILKILLLGGFAYFFSQTLNSGRALLYVNPKMIPFIKFGIIAMCVMMAVTLPELFTIPRRKLRLTPYTIFFIPLLLALVFPAVALDSTSLAGRTVDMGGTVVVQEGPQSIIPTDADRPLDVESAGIVPMGGKIVIDDENFVVWLTALYQLPGEHLGLDVEISGFVHKTEDLEPQTFLLSRFIMTCCTADMQLSGILCHYDQAEELTVDTWFRINGTITVELFNNRPIPAIVVDRITEIEKPEIPYVFP